MQVMTTNGYSQRLHYRDSCSSMAPSKLKDLSCIVFIKFELYATNAVPQQFRGRNYDPLLLIKFEGGERYGQSIRLFITSYM